MQQSPASSDARTLYNYWNKRLKNFLKNSENSSSVPSKLLQKLSIIEQSIMHEEVNKNYYPEMDEQEILQLCSHPEETKISLYMSIAKMFLKDDVVGRIDIRGDSKVIWTQKEVRLDFNLRTLQIQKKSNPKEFHTIALHNFKSKWYPSISEHRLGHSIASRKHMFEIILINQSYQTKFKAVMLGDEDQGNARQWFDCIKICCNVYEEENSSNKEVKQKQRATMAVAQSVSQINSNTVIEENEDLKKKAAKSIITQSMHFDRPSIQPETSGSDTKADKKASSPNPEQQQQQQQPQSQQQQVDQKPQKSSVTSTPKNQQHDPSKSRVQSIPKNQQTENSNGNVANTQKNQQTDEQLGPSAPAVLSTPKNQEKQHKKQVLQQQVQEEQKQSIVQEQKPSGKPEQVVEQVERFVPTIFQQIIADGITNKHNLLSDANYKLMHFHKNMRILQHCDNALNFKLFLLVESTDVVSIIQAIANADELIKWNQQVEQQTKNINVLPDSQTLIVYEKRKKYGRLYLARDFIIMKHIMKTDEGFYILEKSADHEDYLPSMNVVRGEIYWGVWGIFVEPQKNSSFLVYSVYQTNGGYSSSHQDAAISANFLLQFEHLEQYLRQVNFQKEQKAHIPRYLRALFDVPVQEFQSQVEDEETKSSMHEAQQYRSDLKSEPSERSHSNTSEDQSIRQELEKTQMIQEEKMFLYSQKKDDESHTEYLRRLLLDIEQSKPIWNSAIHRYELGPIDVEPKYHQNSENGLHFTYGEDWIIEEKGGMRFVNRRKIEVQKDIIKFMLKKIGTNLISGKSIMSISLPVLIFEKRSNLERHAYEFSYAPIYFEIAAKMTDPVEQMKQVMKVGISSSMLYISMEKPFNPILGETFQGRINGCPIYCEQISHHPPICSVFMIGRGYRFFGHMEIQAQMGANSVVGANVGFLQVEFYNTGNSIQFNIPAGYISGINYGDRMCFIDGVQWFVDTQNNLVGEMIMSTSQGVFSKRTTPLDWVDGRIVKVNDKEIEKFQKETYKKYTGTKGGKFEQLAEVTGRYTSRINFGKDNYWDFYEHFPFQLEYEENPLASDSIYREDLVAWKLDDFDLAQERKEKLENMQRADRKMREKMGPKKGKH